MSSSICWDKNRRENQRKGLLEYKSTEGLRSTPAPILRKPSMDLWCSSESQIQYSDTMCQESFFLNLLSIKARYFIPVWSTTDSGR